MKEEEMVAGGSKLQRLEEHLRLSRFTVWKDVEFEGQSMAILARRAGFELERLLIIENFFMVARFDHVDEATLRGYCRKCFKYALRSRRVPLPWGPLPLHSATSYSVAMVSLVGDSLASRLTRSAPISHWGRGTEFPIVWDITTGRLHYPGATTTWPDMRGLNWDFQRKVALEILAPVA